MALSPEQARGNNVYPQRHTIGETLSRLPGLYLKSIFTPSPRTFAREAEYARWDAVWLQVAILIIVPSLLGLFRGLFKDTSSGIAANSNVAFFTLSALTVGASIGAFILKVIFVPLVFFIGMAIQVLMAKSFKGPQGSYLQQCYTVLLYQVPLSIIGGLVIFILVLFHVSTFLTSPIVTIVLFCYGVWLNIQVVRGIHRLSGERATIVVFIPYILGVLLVCGTSMMLAHAIYNGLHNLLR
jgi:hypothetical protein